MTARVRAEDELLYEVARSAGFLRLELGEAAAKFGDREGVQELGFSTLNAYARQRLSRGGRFVEDAARLARRLAKLPAIRGAYLSGRINLCMAELLARKCEAEGEDDPELEAELLALALARGVTVHAMRDFLRADPGDDEPSPAERCTVTEMLPVEEALFVEATSVLLEHLNQGAKLDDLECLVGEGVSTWPELFDGSIMPEVGEELSEIRARIAAGVAQRREMEERAEPGLPVNAPLPAPAGLTHREPLPDSPRELDERMQHIVMRLTILDLVLGRIASDFFRSSSWRSLGYASDTQYCRERLGMKRSAVWNRITLARRCERLPLLAEAVSTTQIGFEAALLISRVATPRTEAAWIDRAKVRTYKLLREEVRAVEADARLTPGMRKQPTPPTDEEMAHYEDFERAVLTGALVDKVVDPAEIWITRAETPDEDEGPSIQISASPLRPDSDMSELGRRIAEVIRTGRKRKRKGEVLVRFRCHVEIAALYRAARVRYRRLGEPENLLVALCVWLWTAWIHQVRAEQTKYDDIHRRDRHRCASPGCFEKLCTLHHIIMRMLGGDDRWTNMLSLCWICHLKNIHERGSLAVTGEAPDKLTFVFGKEPVFVVKGREMREVAA